MNFLPKELEEIIYEYKYQMERLEIFEAFGTMNLTLKYSEDEECYRWLDLEMNFNSLIKQIIKKYNEFQDKQVYIESMDEDSLTEIFIKIMKEYNFENMLEIFKQGISRVVNRITGQIKHYIIIIPFEKYIYKCGHMKGKRIKITIENQEEIFNNYIKARTEHLDCMEYYYSKKTPRFYT